MFNKRSEISILIVIRHFLTACGFLAGFAIVHLQAQQLPEGRGKEAVLKICRVCHEAEIVVGQARTREGWLQVISDMQTLGAQGSDEEFKIIVDYLAENFPKRIYVNKAIAKDLESVLEITGSSAEAIIGYREKYGPFKSLDDLKKVPDVDIQNLDAKKGRIVF